MASRGRRNILDCGNGERMLFMVVDGGHKRGYRVENWDREDISQESRMVALDYGDSM